VREHLLSQHAIYVAGGSMVNLLAVWRAHGLDRVLREAWESGVLLFGVSAGSLCWFEEGITKGSGECGRAAGLGFLPASNCVHYHGESDRRPAYLTAVRDGMPPGYGVDDGCGLLFEGTELVEVVASRPDVLAYRVESRGQEVQEFPLEPTYLPAAEDRQAAPSPDIAELRSLRAQRASGVGSRRRRVSLLD
jgi:peptidase E